MFLSKLKFIRKTKLEKLLSLEGEKQAVGLNNRTRKFLALPGLELQPFDRLFRSQLIYLLSYHGSHRFLSRMFASCCVHELNVRDFRLLNLFS
jgi:hypothetical protein